MAIFLKFCYPTADPELETLEEVQSTSRDDEAVVGDVQKRLVKVLTVPDLPAKRAYPSLLLLGYVHPCHLSMFG